MPSRRPKCIRRVSVARLVRLLDLEALALTSRRTWVIRSSSTREIAIHFSLMRIGVMRIVDPIGKMIPFFARKDVWRNLEFQDLPRTESHSRLLLFSRYKTIYTVRRGGTPTLSGWAIDLMPLIIAMATLVWPVRFVWRRCRLLFAPALARLYQRRKRRREILQQFTRGERCPSCGYDLRATHDRCPECGISFARKTIIVSAPEAVPDGVMQ